MASSSLEALVYGTTLFNPRPHFSSSPNVKKLRASDIIWHRDAMARLERVLERLFGGEIPVIELEETVIAHSREHPPHSGSDEGGDWNPALRGVPVEIPLTCFALGMPRAYGPTSFAVWNSGWERFQIAMWMSKIVTKPSPILMLTAVGHFLDSYSTIPGVRIGSDLRAYQRSLPVIHRVAVLSFVGMGRGWFYALVFIYGEENGDEPAVTEKVGILRVPFELVGPSVINPEYEDELDLVSKKNDWTYFDEERNVDLMLALPSAHPCPAWEINLYDPPTNARLSHRLRVEGGRCCRGVLVHETVSSW